MCYVGSALPASSLSWVMGHKGPLSPLACVTLEARMTQVLCWQRAACEQPILGDEGSRRRAQRPSEKPDPVTELRKMTNEP